MDTSVSFYNSHILPLEADVGVTQGINLFHHHHSTEEEQEADADLQANAQLAEIAVAEQPYPVLDRILQCLTAEETDDGRRDEQ